MTEQWIGRVTECHLAHRAVVETRVAEQACPLSSEDARIGLSSAQTGFRILITSKDVTVARSLIDRCHALVDYESRMFLYEVAIRSTAGHVREFAPIFI